MNYIPILLLTYSPFDNKEYDHPLSHLKYKLFNNKKYIGALHLTP